MELNEARDKKLNRIFAGYVVPSVVAMAVQAFYVVLNGIIAGRGLGELALAAVNVAFPFMMIVFSLAMLIGIGGANVYSFYKGEGKYEEANNIFNQCFWISAVVGLVMALLGFFFHESIAYLMGANTELLPYVSEYFIWMAPFSFLELTVFGLIVFLRNDGAPRLVMVASIVGAIINIILDIIFVFVLHYGIGILALTNGIALFIQFLFFIPHFAMKKGRLSFKKPVFKMVEIKRVLQNGIASALMELWQSAITLSFNLALVYKLGTVGAAAFSIVNYICAVINMLLIGVVQGAQPLMSYFHGSGNKKAFDRIYKLGVYTNIILPGILAAICIGFGVQLSALFLNADHELSELTTQMLNLYSPGFVFVGPLLMNILYFQTTERNFQASLVSTIRCIGFVQIFIILFMFFFGAHGIFISFLVGEACNLLISYILLNRVKNSISKQLPQ